MVYIYMTENKDLESKSNQNVSYEHALVAGVDNWLNDDQRCVARVHRSSVDVCRAMQCGAQYAHNGVDDEMISRRAEQRLLSILYIYETCESISCFATHSNSNNNNRYRIKIPLRRREITACLERQTLAKYVLHLIYNASIVRKTKHECIASK